MRRLLGVSFAAGLLGFFTGFGLLGIFASLLGTLVMQSPAIHKGTPVFFVLAIFHFLTACFLVYSGWTTVGLFRLRNWARISIIVIGALMFLLFGVMSAATIAFRHFSVPQDNVPSPSFATLFVAIGLFYAVVALIGLWWVIYFNLQHVRLAFSRIEGAIEPNTASRVGEYGIWYGVVLVLAWLFLLSGAWLMAIAWMRLPLYLMGMIVRGNTALVVTLLYAVLAFFIGLGLLRRVRVAYWAALGLQAFALLSVFIFLIQVIFFPSSVAKLHALFNEIAQRFTLVPMSAQPKFSEVPLLMMSAPLQLVLISFVSYALLRCRNKFAPRVPKP